MARTQVILLGNLPSAMLEAAELKAGWIWSRVRIRHDGGRGGRIGSVTGRRRDFTKALEIARVRWWHRVLTSQSGMLRSIYSRLAQLADPPAYLTRSAFAELRCEAERAAGQLAARWPNALSDMPEIHMLRAILDFLEDPCSSSDEGQRLLRHERIEPVAGIA